MRKMAPWLLSALLAIASGVFFLAYLVSSPLRMSLFLALLVGILILWGYLAFRFFRGWFLAADFGLLLVLFALGYLGATRVYLAQSEERELPAITRAKAIPATVIPPSCTSRMASRRLTAQCRGSRPFTS